MRGSLTGVTELLYFRTKTLGNRGVSVDRVGHQRGLSGSYSSEVWRTWGWGVIRESEVPWGFMVVEGSIYTGGWALCQGSRRWRSGGDESHTGDVDTRCHRRGPTIGRRVVTVAGGSSGLKGLRGWVLTNIPGVR